MARAGEIIGTPAPLSALHNFVVTYDSKVNELIEDDDDLREYVERLDSMGDDIFDQEDSPQLEFEFGNDTDEDSENNAHLLVDEVEQFLRDQGSN
jgi:hypothetical protein